MHNRLTVAALALISLVALAGCNSQGEPLKQDESKMLHAAPGQPMPEEAKRYMERANQGAAAARTNQAPAPGGPGAPPPANR